MVTETTNLDPNPLSQLIEAYETSELTVCFPKGPSARYLSIVQRSLILLLFDNTSKSKSIMVSNRSVTSFMEACLHIILIVLPSEHSAPWKPCAHVQFKPLFWQTPPNLQGLSAHLSKSADEITEENGYRKPQ